MPLRRLIQRVDQALRASCAASGDNLRLTRETNAIEEAQVDFKPSSHAPPRGQQTLIYANVLRDSCSGHAKSHFESCLVRMFDPFFGDRLLKLRQASRLPVLNLGKTQSGPSKPISLVNQIDGPSSFGGSRF